MSQLKKQIRNSFRKEVFTRDNYCCRVCGKPGVDVHHITNRNLMPNGGYVLQNGITLCSNCHILAEEHHVVGKGSNEYLPAKLYLLINSSYEEAYVLSKRK